MKKICFIWILLMASIVFSFQVYSDQSLQTSKNQTALTDARPVAVALEPRFEFGTAVEDTVVTHDFIIANQGTAPLSIERVRTSCGCTTASYTKTVEPGAEGKIAIKGHTRGYGGRKFSKTITVYTNDPKQEKILLYLSGNVEAFARIEPGRVYLNGNAGEAIQSKITITPLKKYPFNITDSSAEKALDKKISFTLDKDTNKYILSINNLLKTHGRYRGRIHLKTDSTVKPEIIIPVTGMIREKF